ncbi:MAG TPA: transposase [Gaiellaceae bacterium]|nr:transposase [Gaiellaceae bacterium]
MPRPTRDAQPGGFFHVWARGNRRCQVFEDSADYTTFLSILARQERRHNWRLYAWCLMTTHYHLVVGTPDGGLSAGMCALNGGFARWSNKRHGRQDHLFGKRFGSTEISGDAHLLDVCRYVALNPVRARMGEHPADWPWSSYRASAGYDKAPPFLALGDLLNLFDLDLGRAAASYRAFVVAD